MSSTSLIISGATIIDGVSYKPIEGKSLWIEGSRIRAIEPLKDIAAPADSKVIDVAGKFVIPGLMNANVHLLCDVRLENLAQHSGHLEDLILEAAQVALKNGLTTVFDTWGPRRFLMTARDRINKGEVPGSRIFCSGNIVGFDGPFSADFFAKAAEVASPALVRRINAIWVENVGRHLMWLTPEQVAAEVRAYIEKGIDFVKYASNDHVPGAFLAFSPRTQTAIVEQAHRAGLTAQAHSMSVEGLRIAIEADCDLVTHCNITGPIPIPEDTLELFAQRGTGAVVFASTQRGLDWIMANMTDPVYRTVWTAMETNARNLIRCDARLLFANDGFITAPEAASDPVLAKNWTIALGDESSMSLGQGHFNWFKAMEEKGCTPMKMLQAATRNIALAYGKDKDLGAVECGKIADLLILDKNPLESAENYRSIHMIIKEGEIVDRHALPVKPILTAPMQPPAEEEAVYRPFLSSGTYPICPTCVSH